MIPAFCFLYGHTYPLLFINEDIVELLKQVFG